MTKVKFLIYGTVSGVADDDEILEHVVARLALEVEMKGNEGQARIHIQDVKVIEVDGQPYSSLTRSISDFPPLP